MKAWFSPVWALALREISIWFGGAAGFAVPALYAVAGLGLCFGIYGFFDVGQAELRGFFHFQPWILLFLSPALGMGAYASERARGSEECLMALPLSPWQWVAGKYLGGLLLWLGCCLGTLSFPLSLYFMGKPDIGPLLSGYVGLFLLGASSLAISQLLSNLVRSLGAAYIGAAALLLVWLLVGNAPVVSSLALRVDSAGHSELLTRVLDYIGWVSHYASFERGLLDTRDLAYFLAVTGLPLLGNVFILHRRRRP